MAYPGLTKNATVLDGWTRLAKLYDNDATDKISTTDGQVANQVWVEARTNNVQIAFSLSTPTILGHVTQAGDSTMMNNQEFIKRCWVRNNTAGSAATLIMTPLYE